MSRVITFSRTFPAYHPKAGQPTYFVEKLWESIGLPEKEFCFSCPDEYQRFLRDDNSLIWPKHHTIRAGNRWKVGDKFSPRVWSGKPYNSKQIIIAPDIEIVKVWDVVINDDGIYVNGYCVYGLAGFLTCGRIEKVATNDGLNVVDLLCWFKYPKPFRGQIICWNKDVNY